MAEGLQEAISSPLMAIKKTKSGEKETDLAPLVRSASVVFDGKGLHMDAVFAADGANYVNPELFVTALRAKTGILTGDPLEEGYRICRRAVLLADGETPFR